jgi:hypothetical protein
MQSSVLFAPGTALLAALGGNVKAPPRTPADIMRQIERISAEADRPVRDQDHQKTDDPALKGYFHRISVVLRDVHQAITTATSALSPELKIELGIKPHE